MEHDGVTSAGVPALVPGRTILWSVYVLSLEDICRRAGIPLPRGHELEADLDPGVLRVTVKSRREKAAV